MSKSTLPPTKWYESNHVFFCSRHWSDEDKALLRQEIEQDRRERLRANVMIGEHVFAQLHGWVFQLDPDVRNMSDYYRIGYVRSNGVRKWLRDFWAETELPLTPPWCIDNTGEIPREMFR
jgi:hypothetical protein